PNNGVPVQGYNNNPYSRQAPIRWVGKIGDGRNGQRQPPASGLRGSTLLMTYAGTGATGASQEQSVFAGGSGYAVGDTGTVGGTCSGTTYRVAAVDTGSYPVGKPPHTATLTHSGYVQQVYITVHGTGCT